MTGGSGVVGGALIRHLVRSDHEVRALSRSPVSAQQLVELGAQPVEGDVLDTSALRTLVDGTEVVFHVAGVNDLCPPDPGTMWRINVEGTRAIMTACRSEGIRRLVHTSSAVTVGEPQGTLATEDTPHRGFFLSEYERSKHEAERVLLNEANGLDVVSVNPSSVQGPGRSTGTGRIFLAAANKRLPVLFETAISVVDIDDCARGHVLAAERGAAGERYLLSGAVLEMHDAMRLLSAELGRPLSPWYLKPGAVTAMSAIVERVFGLAGRQPPLCREAARVLLHGHRYDGSRATRELGLEYTSVEDTITRTIDWFTDQGLLSARR